MFSTIVAFIALPLLWAVKVLLLTCMLLGIFRVPLELSVLMSGASSSSLSNSLGLLLHMATNRLALPHTHFDFVRFLSVTRKKQV